MAIKYSVAKVILDFVLLCFTGVPVLVFKLTAKPYLRGFYCTDDTVKYPYRESTVSTGVLMVVGILLPTFSIIFFELLRLRLEKRNRYPNVEYEFGGKRVNKLLVRLYIFIGYFVFGAAMCQVMTDVAKYSIGRLRPHFLDVCKPDFESVKCEPGKYYTEILCTGGSHYLNTESRISFPSGHASFGFYCATYLVLYLQSRVYWHLYSHVARPLIQFSVLLLAYFTALSRISDYKHHWSDVLAGAILGITVASVNGLFVAQLFKRRELPPAGFVSIPKAVVDNGDDIDIECHKITSDV